MGKARTRVTFRVVNEVVVPSLLRMTYINRFIKSMYPAERNIVPYHLPPVPILLIHEAKSDHEENKLELSNDPAEDLAL